MKRAGFYFLMVMLVLLIVNFYFFFDFDRPLPAEPYNISVVAEHRYMRYPVYFVGKGRLVESREYTDVIWRDRYQNILSVYFAQAELPVEARGMQIMNIPIDKLIVSSEHIYVYTRLLGFRDARYNRENFYLYLMSLVNSLTEEGRGKTVFFIFDEKTRAPEIFGIDMNQGFHYDSTIVAENTDGVEVYIRQFFNEIYAGEHQAAYRKILRETRGAQQIRDVFKAFESYVFYHNSEFPWDFIVEKNREEYQITVVFSPGSTNADEIWIVREVNGKLMVSYPQDIFDRLP